MDALWPLAIVAGYLIGSVPFGVLVARSKGVDLRAVGSGNIGATNVGRALGRRLGALCFALDFLKGFAPTLAAGLASGALTARDVGPVESLWWLGVAAATVLGHVFPVWLRFRGGKGVATAAGATLAVWPVMTIAAGLAAVVWCLCAAATRYVGLSSSAAAVSLPVWAALAGRTEAAGERAVWPYVAAAAALALLVVVRHRGNLARTVRGTEPKIGRKAAAGDAAR